MTIKIKASRFEAKLIVSKFYTIFLRYDDFFLQSYISLNYW